MPEIMSSCALVPPCRRSELRSFGYNAEQFSELPQDILVDEILLRLPVKSLVRFKVVCKFWYDLIRSPNFMTLHDTSSKKKGVPFYFDSYSIRGPNLTTETDITLGFFDTNVPLDLLLKLTVPLRVGNVRLVGCCNGIVCLSLTQWHDTFALWNPATTQCRLINLSHSRDAYWIYSSFFFDSVADSCKLVTATFLTKKSIVILSIFTLNDNNNWRNKELPLPSLDCAPLWHISPVTCSNTCMYWIVTRTYWDQDKYILCLDAVDEVFKHIIEFPSVDYVYYDAWLLDYKGSLAMFVWEDVLPCDCFDMWVLNDDCGGNWHKKLTLRPSKPEVKKQPLGFISKEGNDLVLLYTYSPSSQFLLWETNSGKTTEVIKRNGLTWMHPYFLYSESFASV